MLKISIRKLVISLLFASASFVVTAADVTIETAANIASQCYAVGDTVTVSGGDAAAVLGDGIATLNGSTITMKHAGFTLLKDAGGTEYWFAVYEAPGGEGDVFLATSFSSTGRRIATTVGCPHLGRRSRSIRTAPIRTTRTMWQWCFTPEHPTSI